ncbi:tetratricopeptide repeat protein [Sphingomonas sp. PAMC 26617]|uniref:tetratricopeptide repeat protein n=1 Tax=Sphingomonas sp. PAMC 26617 TaxID=1112216 RepID=UPI0003129148|nr:tetratricopeptide repeat protein [Sphingomonas sp. PAMC 26617]
MRYTSFAVAAALTLVTIGTAVQGQRAEDAIDARSLALLAKGRALQAAGNLDAATDLLESAVAIDPRNRDAFTALGQVAQSRALPGKAIRLYREALSLDSNDIVALRGQGEALVARGAVLRAKENLAKIRTVCAKRACPEIAALTASIAKGPPVVTASAATVVPPPAGIPTAKN